MDDLSALDATAQADLVRRRDVTPLELVDAAIARIEREKALNAVVQQTFERARQAARGTLPTGPFTGVPFLLKDLAGGAEAGVPLTFGSVLLRDYVPDYDTELVSRFKRAGLVIVGRTHATEFGIPPTSESALFGTCENPWALGRSAGGSSGGAAAAVAARLVPFAHASDAGGSIRIPASCCGVFGLKPTRGRNPMGPKLGESTGGFITEHCVSISVRDSAALLDATSTPDRGAPYSAPPKARPFIEELSSGSRRLRIGVMRVPLNGAPVDAECLAALDSAAALCAELGHEVFDDAVRLSNIGDLLSSFMTLWTVNALMNLTTAERLAGRAAGEGDVEPLTRALASMGRSPTGLDFLEAQRTLHRLSREVAESFGRFDVLLTPTLTTPPIVHGALACPPEEPLRGFLQAGAYAAFTPLFNITGQPAMSVPLWWSASDVPIGVQFAGRFGDEATLFWLAARLEEARPWAARRPKFFTGGP
jgi:amidase